MITKKCTIIDCGDDIVTDYVKHNKLDVVSLMATHKHHDHIGGIPNFLKFKSVDVYANPVDQIPYTTKDLFDAQTVQPLESDDVLVDPIAVPCHTRGHMLFSFKQPSESVSLVFVGDCIFVAGCGRFFEGSPADWFAISNEILPKRLQDEDVLFCAHDYTIPNLKFSISCYPENEDVLRQIEHTLEFKKNKDPSSIEALCTQSTYGLEKKINPFLMYQSEYFQQMFEGQNVLDTILQLRTMRSNFNASSYQLPL
eukprot:GDKJ01013712.1.p1 GENE.GDKJ01013712.1~~GDKJ01013712.1.p1  ORF type:complete len:287 (+),score=39.28 GDKJ01013712.1:102-863(+)